MHVEPITGVFGAEITGIDLKSGLAASTAEALRDALAHHLVIVLRDQYINVAAHQALTRVFGMPAINPYAPGPDAHPEMTTILKEADERTGVFGGGWHTDLSFLDRP
ncbi:MAG: TauD/TfdA family dioxygenase, partial [Pseudomonadota bacterium]